MDWSAIANINQDDVSQFVKVWLQGSGAILSLLIAAFTALCAGLARGFARPGFATSASAGRTLDLPVLATATLKPAGAR